MESRHGTRGERMSRFTDRKDRRRHEEERNFVRIDHCKLSKPNRNRSSIELSFHGISFRTIGKHRAAVYHQLDGALN
jgi:hypothetical protein